MRRLLATFILSFVVVSSVFANQKIISIGTSKPLSINGLYRLSIDCKFARDQKHAIRWTALGYGSIKQTLVLSKTLLPDNQLPADPAKYLSILPVAYATRDKGTTDVLTNEVCSTSMLLAGSQPVYLYSSYWTKKVNDPIALRGLNDLLAVFSPIGPIFGFDKVVAKFGHINDAQKPTQTFLNDFDKDSTDLKSASLRVGTTRITTDYTVVTLKVEPIKSVAESGDNNLIAAMNATYPDAEKLIDGATNDSVAEKCRKTAAFYRNAAFGELDVSYILGNAAGLAGFDKAKTLACLGDNYTKLAVNRSFWAKYPDAAYSLNDLNPPKQKGFSKELQANLRAAINVVNKYVKASDNERPSLRPTFDRFFAHSLDVTDYSEVFAQNSLFKISPSDFFDALSTQGYKRFGCISSAVDYSGMFLAIAQTGSGPATTYRQEDARSLLLKVDPKTNLITGLDFDFQVGPIAAALAANGNTCGPSVRVSVPSKPDKSNQL